MEVVQDIPQEHCTNPSYMDDVNQQTDRNEDSRPSASLPPELVGLIVRYLDRKDLIKVLALNWTWAYLAASQLWSSIHLRANSNKIVFLVTKSVPPADDDVRIVGEPLEGLCQGREATATTTSARRGSNSSYPWPTLLPYHSMVQSLSVSLSSADMVQDLIDVICCCTELRSFTIHSVIPTEDLLFRGVVSMANRDGLDPMDGSSSPHPRHRGRSHSSVRNLEASLAFQMSPGLRQGDQEAMAASLTSQSGLIFKLLANSCPKLERIHISGFHPVAVLGSAVDLRPLPPKFDMGLYRDPLFPTTRSSNSSTSSLSSSMNVQPLVYRSTPGSPLHSFVSSYTQAPSTASTGSLALLSATTNIPPLPTTATQVHSHIQSLHFVNCTVPPQYLINMIQYALPELTELSLMQSWRDAPLGGSFLPLLARACPRLKSVSFHSTQNHRGAVDSDQVLEFLQALEDREVLPLPSMQDFGSNPSSGVIHPAGNPALQREIEAMAEVPLGSFRRRGGSGQSSGYSSVSGSSSIRASTIHRHQHRQTRDIGVQVSLDVDAPSHPSGTSSSVTTLAMVMIGEDNDGTGEDDQRTNQKGPSALESLRVWFTHPILNQEIMRELADKTRHPKLKFVEFGSEDPFDAGEAMLLALKRDRPEIQTSWVFYGDTGEDRDD